MRNLLQIFNVLKRYKSTINTCTEMKYLNVAEKHDAAKTIAGFLSNGSARRREGYSVYNKIFDFDCAVKGKNAKMVMTSVSGHLLNFEFIFSYKNWTGCDPEQLFDAPIRKACSEDAAKIRRTLEREVKSCQALIVWTDCDREGENIGFEVIDVCRAIKPNIAVYRAKFSEITQAAVRRALANLVEPDFRQSQAVDVRQELDLRTGAAFTRYQTLRLQRLFPVHIADNIISYGSCQIPTLGFVAKRYKEAEAFVPEPFWKLKVTHTIEDLTVEFNWERVRLFDKEACEDYLMLCLTDPIATVDSVTTKPKNKWRPTPMDTVQMEKLGSRKLKLSAKTTMQIAEKLYTKGFISYPRTETNIFSKEINLRSLVEQQTAHPQWGAFSSKILDWGPNPRNGSKSDQAHPPIHPLKLATGLSGDEERVFELITRHFLACVSKDATGSETIVKITIAGEKFTANGLCIFERNYLDVYPYENWNAKQIHRYEIGQQFEPTEINMQEGSTTAPPLLTEADLIALMEKHGIGTDSTHAEHIDKIKERGYIGVVDKGLLVPGSIGMGLYEGYDAMELPLAEPLLRAEFEVDLKKICDGEKDPKLVLREQIQKYKEAYRIIMDRVRRFDEKIGQRLDETPQESSPEQTSTTRLQELFKCPKCSQASMTLRQKKDNDGYYIGCLNFPECRNAIWFPSEAIKEITVKDTHCSKCGPAFKKFEIKFKTNNYLALLNATSNVYVTCLACDRAFRELFDINIDNIKNVGAIVSDSNSVAPRTVNNSSSGPVVSRNERNNPAVPPQNTRGLSTTNSSSTSRAQRNLPSAGSRGAQSSINNYFTSNNTAREENVDEMMETIPEDFLEDDGFDELMLDADEPLPDNLRSTSTSENMSWGSRNQSVSVRTESWNSSNHTNQDRSSIMSNQSSGSRGGSSNNNRGNNSNWNSNIVPSLDRENAPNETRSEWGSRSNSRSNFNSDSSNQRSARGSNSNTNQSTNSSNFPSRSTNSNSTSIPWGSMANQGRYPTDPNVVKCDGCRKPARGAICKTEGVNKGKKYYTCSKQPRPCKFFRWADPDLEDDFNMSVDETVVHCSGCNAPAKQLTVRKEGPNKGRFFFVCPQSSCTFFQWADENQNPNATVSNNNDAQRARDQRPQNNSSSEVLCTGCNLPARQLTVRKEGPNIGRLFYACPNQQSNCKFFQWADEEQNSGEATTSWGSSSGSTSSNARGASTSNAHGSNRNAAPKKRKCGLCRQEGHTKLKCPRKAEFE